jgi:glycosyltransferase involved in cell wall biosynthesis
MKQVGLMLSRHATACQSGTMGHLAGKLASSGAATVPSTRSNLCKPDVAVYLPSLDGGGAELVMLRVATALADAGRRTDLVLACARGPYLDDVPPNVRLVDLAAPPPVVVTKTLRFASYLRRERPRAILSALDVVDTALVSRALARVPARLVLTIHTHLSSQFADKPDWRIAQLRRTLVRLLYPRTDQLIAVSRGVADDVERLAGLPAGRVAVIPNPVVASDLADRAGERVDHPFLQPGGAPVVLGVGRLVRQKDFPTLIEAFGLVRANRPARLIILGDRDPREPDVPPAIEAVIDGHGLRDDVSLPGFVANPYAYIAGARVFALSSIYEGLPTVLIEALAVGTTIVATDCESGPREILDGGRYGALVPVGDPRALAEGILGALDAPHDPADLRHRSQRYTPEAVIGEYLQLIEREGSALH